MEQAELIQPIKESILKWLNENNIKYRKITENWCSLYIILDNLTLFKVNYDDDRDFYHIKFRNRKTDVEIKIIIEDSDTPYRKIDKIIYELVNKYLEKKELING